MTTARRSRSRTTQPELPLRLASAAPSRRPAPPEAADWRIDEDTRRVGRRGIAAARERLAATRTRADDGSKGLDHQRTGRAA